MSFFLFEIIAQRRNYLAPDAELGLGWHVVGTRRKQGEESEDLRGYLWL